MSVRRSLGSDAWEWHETGAGPVAMRKMTPGRSTPLPTVIVRDGLVLTTDVGPTATPLSVMKAVIAENEVARRSAGPMEPERLDELRHESSLMRVSMIPRSVLHVSALIDEALADREHHVLRADAAERERDSARDECTYALRNAAATRGDLNAVERERDELMSEVARLRARVRVNDEDIQRFNVTRAHVEAWLRANGWEFLRHDGTFAVWGYSGLAADPRSRRLVIRGDHPGCLADVVHAATYHHDRPGLDILEEMAAMEVSTP